MQLSARHARNEGEIRTKHALVKHAKYDIIYMKKKTPIQINL